MRGLAHIVAQLVLLALRVAHLEMVGGSKTTPVSGGAVFGCLGLGNGQEGLPAPTLYSMLLDPGSATRLRGLTRSCCFPCVLVSLSSRGFGSPHLPPQPSPACVCA
jgi:hypothetical protein